MSAQTISINSAEVCAGQEVLLPVTGSSLANVGALTLYIGFDTTNLTFTSIENIDPQLTGMSTNMMSFPSQLAFAWSSTSAINFSNAKLFDLKFVSNGQTAPVFYNPGCELADPSGTTIPATYTNGAILNGIPLISTQPHDTSVNEGGHASFSAGSSGTGNFFWRESQDNGTSWLTLEDDGIYSGTHTSGLSISPVPLSFNNFQYQCVLSGQACQALTVPVTLKVGTLTSNDNLLSATVKNLRIAPVPFNDHATLEFTMPETGTASIQVMNCLGQTVFEITMPSQTKGPQYILLHTSEWQPGVYFIKFMLILASDQSTQIIKTIKNF